MKLMEKHNSLRRWELALLLGLALAALLGVWLDGQQAALADKVIRLHVIANSDSPEDQALKLQVRDRILEEAGDLIAVTASLEDGVWFPTKEYTDFSLPAGQYTALRVVIGAGGGRNWWCVVFPPLCLGSVSETAAETAAGAGFTQDQLALISGEDEGYVVKFKAMELWEAFRAWAEG